MGEFKFPLWYTYTSGADSVEYWKKQTLMFEQSANKWYMLFLDTEAKVINLEYTIRNLHATIDRLAPRTSPKEIVSC